MASPKLWAEVWKRPGHGTFGPVIADVPVISGSGTSPVNGVGEGRITIPKSYDRLDEILHSDPATPANAVSSLIRVFSESSATPIFEFIPAVFTGEQDKADPDIEIVGPKIDVIWGYARLEAWDWTGIDEEHSNWPDWIWGGRNVLGDLESAYKPAVTKLYRDPAITGGTWILGISFNGGAISNTNTIAWNVTAAALRTEIIAELVAMGHATGNVEVSGSGSVADPWRIQTILPEGEYVFSVNSGGLTPSGLIFQDRETIGVIVPAGWTTSFNPVNNLPHGNVSEFRISTFTGGDPAAPACDTSGFAIMFDGGLGEFPGIQKIVPIKPGGQYYATATALPQGANSDYRLVIRDLYEAGVAASPGFQTGTTLTSNTWTAFDINSITMPSDRDRVIFRFASVGGNDPPPTFVTCMELREGMPPTTWGDILTQLWLDATSDHAGRQVWQIGAGATNFLTLDFDASLTSAGTAWADPEVSITLKRGQTYLRVLGEAAKMGYEWRIVPDSVTTGTWKLQVYNTGEMGIDQSAISNGPSIQGGRDVTRRDLRRFLPPATDVAVEAGGQNIARSRNASAITALGRIEQYVPNQDLGSMVEAATSAAQAVAVNVQRSQSLSYVLTPTTLDPEPFVAYNAADTLYVLDPPDVPTREARRIKSLGFTFTKDRTEYTVQLESESYVGVGSIAAGVDFLLKEFKAIREQPEELVDALNFFPFGGTGTPTVVLAAYNATELSMEKADFVCPGVADEGIFNVALGILASKLNDGGVNLGGRIVLTEGDYYFANDLDITSSVRLEGMGKTATVIHIQGAANCDMFHLPSPFSGNFELIALGLDGNKANQTAGTSTAIRFDPNAGTGQLSIHDAHIYGFTGNGITLDRAACQFSMTSSVIEDNNLVGAYLFVEGSYHIANSAISGNGTIGIQANGAGLELVSTIIDDNGTHGFSAGGIFESTQKLIVGCAFTSNGGNGILWDGVNGVVIGNYIANNGQYGMELFGNQPLVINGNVIANNTLSGALLQGGAGNQGGIFSNNTVKQNQQHGIFIAGANWAVNGNRVESNSQQTTNTYDGIFTNTNADDCEILNNKIMEAAGGTAMRYGIHVVNGATANWVAGNRVLGALGTANYNLVDASTIQVWAGATGDNQ